MRTIEISLYLVAAQLVGEKKVQEFYSILYNILFGRIFGLQSLCRGCITNFPSKKKYRQTAGVKHIYAFIELTFLPCKSLLLSNLVHRTFDLVPDSVR